MTIERLEDRTVPSGVAPKNLLIYYGYPSLINGSTNNSQAAGQLARYDYVVLGDGLELTSHPDHLNTVAILADSQMAFTTTFGYIDLGVTTQNLSLTEIDNRIDEWQATGARGIFLDDFGYDFGTTRDRQNAAVQYAHGKGLPVVANAFQPDDAFGNTVDPVHNPDGTPTALGATDFYLYESYQVSQGKYDTESNWQSKSNTLQGYQDTLGFKILSVTTNSAQNPYSQNKFYYAWYSALLYGHEATGWGEYQFASNTDQAPFRTPPAVTPGGSFLGSVTNASPLYTRDTSVGQDRVTASTHTYAFKAHHLVLTGLPSTVLAGTANTLTVTVRDASNAVVTGYAGTIHFSSSDGQALLPPDYTFQTTDNGRHTFSHEVTLNTLGSQTVSAFDTAASSITGHVQVTVKGGTPAVFRDPFLVAELYLPKRNGEV